MFDLRMDVCSVTMDRDIEMGYERLLRELYA